MENSSKNKNDLLSLYYISYIVLYIIQEQKKEKFHSLIHFQERMTLQISQILTDSPFRRSSHSNKAVNHHLRKIVKNNDVFIIELIQPQWDS